MKSGQKLQSLILRSLVWLFAAITACTALGIVGYILAKGVAYLSPRLFAWQYTSENLSLLPAIVNTLTIALLAFLIALPLGIFSAVYLNEYARRGSRFVTMVNIAAETLSGIPSIVYGLFGYLLFVTHISGGYSLLAGALTLSIMILPIVLRTTQEALSSVPDSYRAGSFALGAGKLRTVFRIALPAATPGILAGVILCAGRIVGETAALIYTAGAVAQVPENLLGSGRTLSVHLYALWNEGLHTNEAYATAVVLLVCVAGLNALSSMLAKRIAKGRSK
ncbi:MAG: phosphate ABC transporter permease PstA [Oscillospiraceae bacterium]|jgi:phosphate transport system permease protein|nr:phosphate ABC transporter permease PstA [Oscillospiraceae bacterium]